MPDHIQIKTVRTDEELRSIARLRYEVYIEELGWSSGYADHAQRLLQDPLDYSANIFGAFRDGEATGTIRTNCDSASFGIYHSLYELDPILKQYPGAVSLTSMLLVRATARQSRLPFLLAMSALQHGLQEGMKVSVIDCDFGKIPFYRKVGFEIHREQIVHPDYGPGACMILDLAQAGQRFLQKERETCVS